jgi:hypothetical protein
MTDKCVSILKIGIKMYIKRIARPKPENIERMPVETDL